MRFKFVRSYLHGLENNEDVDNEDMWHGARASILTNEFVLLENSAD